MSGFEEKRRVVVQIAVTAETEWEYATVYALCDDGSVWFSPHFPEGKLPVLRWHRVPDIPQGDED